MEYKNSLIIRKRGPGFWPTLILSLFAITLIAEGIPEMSGSNYTIQRDIFGSGGTIERSGASHEFHDAIGQSSPVFEPDSSIGTDYSVAVGFLPPDNYPILAFTMSDSSWDAGNLELGEVQVMLIADSIKLTNIGDIPLSWGLEILSTGSRWNTGPTPALDRFTLRGQFRLSSSPPGAPGFDPIFDWIDESTTWSTNTLFGSNGWNVPTSGDMSSNYLWLMLMAPDATSYWGTFDQTLKIGVKGRAYMP